MKHIIAFLLIFSIFLASCATQVENNNNEIEEQETNEQEHIATVSLSIPDQEVFQDVLYISKVEFDKPGFIVVENSNGIVGNSDVYLEGTYTDVGVTIKNYENDNELTATLYYDDGDNTFEVPGDDKPVTVAGEEYSVVIVLK